MTTDCLPGKRYIFRELIPRAALLSITFKYAMPALPFALFRFSGGLGAGLVFGVAFTALFCLFGAYLMGSAPVMRFMDTHKKDWWFIPANVLIVIGVPMVALLVAAWIAPGAFAMRNLYSALLGSIVLNIACAITHDYRAGRDEIS